MSVSCVFVCSSVLSGSSFPSDVTHRTPPSSEQKVRDEVELARQEAAREAEAIRAAEVAAEKARLAHKAIFAFKTNAAGKAADRMLAKQKKARLAHIMDRFRKTALASVRATAVFGAKGYKPPPQTHFEVGSQSDGLSIDKEMAALRKENERIQLKEREANWASALVSELERTAQHDATMVKAGESGGDGSHGAVRRHKKHLIDSRALPAVFAAQITSFRMSYKDIKRFKSRKVPALLRLASDIYPIHADLRKSTDHGGRKSSKTRGRRTSSSPQRGHDSRGNVSEAKKDKVFAATIYTYFLEKYGLPEIADANMVGLAAALITKRHDHPRLDAFSRFAFGEVSPPVAMGYSVGIVLLAEASAKEQHLLLDEKQQEQEQQEQKHQEQEKQKQEDNDEEEQQQQQQPRRNAGGEDMPKSVGASAKPPSLPSGSSPSPRKAGRERRKSRRKSVTSSHWSGGSGDSKNVIIPLSEDWLCSLSAIKSAMAVTMKSVRTDIWSQYLAEVEAKAPKRMISPSSKSKRKKSRSSSAESAGSGANDNTQVGTAFTDKDGSRSPSSRGKNAKRKVMSHVAKGTLTKHSRRHWGAQPYKVAASDHHRFICADECLELFLEYWVQDLGDKEKHLAHLFLSADVDGDGQLTASEFTALCHSIDPEVPVKVAIGMYRAALKQNPGDESITPEIFVSLCYKTGLVHRAWCRHDRLFDLSSGRAELRKTWSKAEPFVLGTLRSLERDLPANDPLRTCKEAGDGSLPDIVARLENFRKFMLSGDKGTTKMAWHSYWVMLRHVNEAAAAGPGVHTIYGNDVPGTLRGAGPRPAAGKRWGKGTAPQDRTRRGGLPFVFLADPARLCGTTSSWGPSGGARRDDDYLVPARLKVNDTL